MWLPRFVARIRKEHPDLMLQPYVDLGRRLERQVSRGELDFAIAVGPAVDEHVASEAFSMIKIAWVASPSRFRPGTILDARELGRHPIITMTEGSAMTRAFDHWADEQGLKVQRFLASNSLAAVAGLVEADIGISFLPEAYIAPWTRSGRLVTLRSRPPLPDLRYCFLHRQDDSRAVVRHLHRLVIEEANAGAPSPPRAAKKKRSVAKRH
jgi:DNA-binding transcriptional LysR family regulator